MCTNSRDRGERHIPQDEQLDHVKCWKTSVITLKQKIILNDYFFFKSPNIKTVQANKILSFLASQMSNSPSFQLREKKSVHIQENRKKQSCTLISQILSNCKFKKLSFHFGALRQHETYLLSSFFFFFLCHEVQVQSQRFGPDPRQPECQGRTGAVKTVHRSCPSLQRAGEWASRRYRYQRPLTLAMSE